MPNELKRQNQSIYEKIEKLIEWNKKYPLIKVNSPFGKEKYLERYCHSKEEYEELSAQFEEMQKMYTYIRTRKSQGKLTPEQEKMCIEGNIRGIFGFPTTTQNLSGEYGLEPKKIDHLISKYGSMEGFIQALKIGKIDREDEVLLSNNLTMFVDINKSKNINVINFVKSLFEKINGDYTLGKESYEIKIFNSERIELLLNKLEPKQAQIIRLSFGLYDGKEYSQPELAEMFGVTQQAINAIIQKSLASLARHEKYTHLVFRGGECSQIENTQELSPEQKMRIDYISDKIYSSKLIFLPDEGLTQEPDEITSLELARIAAQIKSIREESSSRKKFTPIEKLGLSTRAYNVLTKANIRWVEQLKNITSDELFSLKSCGKKTLEEIQQKMAEFMPESELQRLKVSKQNATREAKAERVKVKNAINLYNDYVDASKSKGKPKSNEGER